MYLSWVWLVFWSSTRRGGALSKPKSPPPPPFPSQSRARRSNSIPRHGAQSQPSHISNWLPGIPPLSVRSFQAFATRTFRSMASGRADNPRSQEPTPSAHAAHNSGNAPLQAVAISYSNLADIGPHYVSNNVNGTATLSKTEAKNLCSIRIISSVGHVAGLTFRSVHFNWYWTSVSTIEFQYGLSNRLKQGG